MDNRTKDEIQDFTAIVQGNTKVFEHLFNRYYMSLCEYANSYVGDREVAEDVVQDAFVYFWNHREKIELKVSMKAYLYTSVRNGALNVIKRQVVERRHHPLITEFVEYLGSMDYYDEEMDDIKRVKQALAKLPEQCRTVFLKSCIDGKKYQEIADEMGISINTVKTHVSKAHRLLRQELERKIAPVLLYWMDKIFL